MNKNQKNNNLSKKKDTKISKSKSTVKSKETSSSKGKKVPQKKSVKANNKNKKAKVKNSIAQKQISNPASTGGLGIHFENRVQSAYAIIMLAGGFTPCMPVWPIEKIKLQGRYQGFSVDDLIIYCKDIKTNRTSKLLGQIKRSLKINKGDKTFFEVIQAAWHDFKDKDIFAADNYDAIALICGPLSATDTENVRTLLNQARNSEDAQDFIKRIQLVNFTSKGQREKLEVFKHHLKKANNNIALTDDELWHFLKIFHLLICDLDIKGVTFSLLHTIIGQYSNNDANSIWAQTNNYIEEVNENAGLIELTSIPENIRNIFQKRQIEVIPTDIVSDITKFSSVNWNSTPQAIELVVACLVGSWNENSPSDKFVISQLAKTDYDNWIQKIREVLQHAESPISFNNGIWKIKDRKKLWQSLQARIFADGLLLLKKCAINVLKERDPQFDIPKDERFSASINGKVLSHSPELRKGLAESLAYLGSNSATFKNCNEEKIYQIITTTVRDIFSLADWKLWAGLNNLLPLLAEAAPEEFLDIVEDSLKKDPCPFDKIFKEEGDGLTGWNYITGLLWALETLAWKETFIVRTTLILGELEGHDPGGIWANRPANSLSTIFLPWLPQTIASFEKRKVAIQILDQEFPDVAWRLLINLLPNQYQTSTRTRQPQWRDWIPTEWIDKVTNKEYWDQVFFFAELAVKKAKDAYDRLKMLIENIDCLPKPAFDLLLEYLSSESITSLEEEQRLDLWKGLTEFTSKHKKYFEAEWALPTDLIKRIDDVANKLKPIQSLNLYARLFTDNDDDLYENDNWDEQGKLLEQQRVKALNEILKEGGVEKIFKLLSKVLSTFKVGVTLGSIADDSIDREILPEYLGNEDKVIEYFVDGYISKRYQNNGWEWADKILGNFSKGQIARFLICLPFTDEVWQRVNSLISESEPLYWKKVIVNPYITNNDLNTAIDKLLKYNRPLAAIKCLFKEISNKKAVDIKKAIKALMLAPSSQEVKNGMDTYYITNIIKYLQNDKSVPLEDMLSIEWIYLPLLENRKGPKPTHLEKQLATVPAFFNEIIKYLYRSTKQSQTDKKVTKKDTNVAITAWRLLNKWKVVPGMLDNGQFNEKTFENWLKETLELCKETGHLEVALSEIGKVLFYSPSDINGFWINKTIANVLNSKDFDKMRQGYYTGVINSRGIYTVDPTGKPELELASNYRKKAEETENAGFQRFSVTLRKIAQRYEAEAKHIIEEHKSEMRDE